jgi:GNAT superfamily N-acetyltransferase
MHEVSFRSCVCTDLNRVQNFVEQLYTTEPGQRKTHPDIQLTFAEFECRPEKGEIIVFEQSNEFGGDIIEVDEMVIEQKSRSRGIGPAFFNWLEQGAAYSCVGYALQTSAENEAAKKLSKKMGFLPAQNQYYIKLCSAKPSNRPD